MGMFALVDDVDADVGVGIKWHLSSTGYAINTAGKGLALHRVIGLRIGEVEGMDIDHRNGDRLDCRRQNLRVCTRSMNCRNRKGSGNWPVVSQFRGVIKRFICEGWYVLAPCPVGQVCWAQRGR
jgi:hypothetical protein